MKLGPYAIGNAFEAVDESGDCFAVDDRVGAGECLECFVGLGIAFATQNGLYGFEM